jgi:hypothetical protein
MKEQYSIQGNLISNGSRGTSGQVVSIDGDLIVAKMRDNLSFTHGWQFVVMEVTAVRLGGGSVVNFGIDAETLVVFSDGDSIGDVAAADHLFRMRSAR